MMPIWVCNKPVAKALPSSHVLTFKVLYLLGMLDTVLCCVMFARHSYVRRGGRQKFLKY